MTSVNRRVGAATRMAVLQKGSVSRSREAEVSDFCYEYPMLERVFAQCELMDAMMAAVGVDPLVAIRRDRGASWYEARTRCIHCTAGRECRAWLASPGTDPARTPASFCPNIDFFRDCQPSSKLVAA